MTNDQADAQKIKALKKWLSENVLVIPEPKTVTLYDFQTDWERWRGTFRVHFGKLTTFKTFDYGMLITGHTGFYGPIFTSPLGVPASYAAVEMTEKTGEAITKGLKLTFPKLKPCGKNRDTGVEITYHSPLSDRISSEELSKAKERVNETYSVTVPLAS